LIYINFIFQNNATAPAAAGKAATVAASAAVSMHLLFNHQASFYYWYSNLYYL